MTVQAQRIRWRTTVAVAILGAALGASIASGLRLGADASPPVIHAYLLPAPVIHAGEHRAPSARLPH
jgi:hypothetical protein